MGVPQRGTPLSPKLAPLLIVPMLAFRTAHIAVPSLWLTTGLWFAAALLILAWTRMLQRSHIPLHGAALVVAGALCNGTVMLVNGGVMPVFGLSPGEAHGSWRSAEEGGHLLFLADRMSLGGASPGDFLIAAGLLFTVGFVILRGLRSFARHHSLLAG